MTTTTVFKYISNIYIYTFTFIVTKEKQEKMKIIIHLFIAFRTIDSLQHIKIFNIFFNQFITPYYTHKV